MRFVCRICSRRFKTKTNLRIHLTNHVARENNTTRKEQPVLCTQSDSLGMSDCFQTLCLWNFFKPRVWQWCDGCFMTFCRWRKCQEQRWERIPRRGRSRGGEQCSGEHWYLSCFLPKDEVAVLSSTLQWSLSVFYLTNAQLLGNLTGHHSDGLFFWHAGSDNTTTTQTKNFTSLKSKLMKQRIVATKSTLSTSFDCSLCGQSFNARSQLLVSFSFVCCDLCESKIAPFYEVHRRDKSRVAFLLAQIWSTILAAR